MSLKSASCRPRQSKVTRPLTTPVMNGVFSKTSMSPRGASRTPVRPKVWPRSRATYHVPRSFERPAQHVFGVLLVLEIGVAEHRLQDDQPAQLRRSDKRVLVVRPETGVFDTATERRILLAEARRQLRVRLRRLVGLPPLHVVDRRLVIADAPENSRRHDFCWRLRRELDAPLALARSRDRIAAAESALLDLDDGIRGRRIGGEAFATHSPEEIASCRRLTPQLRELGPRRRSGQCRLHWRMAAGHCEKAGDQCPQGGRFQILHGKPLAQWQRLSLQMGA